ncbi:MAG: PHP domain-containing protein [Lactobacillaceae bacterium]|jgi:histidinol-phosphatase (PHP family)|nr:PHP domain-containing protein [Lactobacillaceae bacterium]
MKIQDFSYHTHTDFSDGKNTLEEMIEQAVRLGWSEIGVSDHLAVHHNMKDMRYYKDAIMRKADNKYHSDFLATKELLKRRIEKIRIVSKNYPIKVLIGFEADVFGYDGWFESFQKMMEGLDTDYLLLGAHFCSYGDEIAHVLRLKQYVKDEGLQKELISQHFRTIKNAIETNIYDFVAHLDYARLSGICGEEGFKEERAGIIEALSKTNMPYEMRYESKFDDFYPARWMIKELQKKDVPIIISDDAHKIENLGKGFEKAEQILHDMNYANRWKL